MTLGFDVTPSDSIFSAFAADFSGATLNRWFVLAGPGGEVTSPWGAPGSTVDLFQITLAPFTILTNATCISPFGATFTCGVIGGTTGTPNPDYANLSPLSITIQAFGTPAVPEPSGLALFVWGLSGTTLLLRRRRVSRRPTQPKEG